MPTFFYPPCITVEVFVNNRLYVHGIMASNICQRMFQKTIVTQDTLGVRFLMK